MSFLSKFGKFVLKGLSIVTGIAPIVSQAVPGSAQTIQVVSQDLAQVADIVTKIEVIGQQLGKPGAEKLALAAPLVADVIIKSSLLANQKIDNPALFSQGSKKIADGMADILNSLNENGVKTTDKTN
jgi:hypothetical protein